MSVSYTHLDVYKRQGNKYCTENDVIGWLREDKYAVNSVYVWWKYNKADVKQLPVVESSKDVYKRQMYLSEPFPGMCLWKCIKRKSNYKKTNSAE